VRKAKRRFRRMRSARVTLQTKTTIGGTSTPARRSLRLKR
jgi:hypothetical protein